MQDVHDVVPEAGKHLETTAQPVDTTPRPRRWAPFMTACLHLCHPQQLVCDQGLLQAALFAL
jgi:hypothetical protein